ncbi:MAG TPA: metalloregulator ArsR/SmtB family transcription factor [Alphaproteobacteria bacterium]|jgi:DNA-binding transcriptional ArsR family regulator|nr:metalloregulator ArsR/SmtB family transcription factor [Alphaproteobacteria bacterium]
MDAKQVVTALGALAHETRLAVFRMLVERGPDGLPAGAMSERLAIPPSSLTFHLQQLATAGLITQRRVSRQIIYATDFDAMNRVVGYLTENCCGIGAACAPACRPSDTGTDAGGREDAA